MNMANRMQKLATKAWSSESVRVRAIEDERLGMVLKCMRLSISETLNCGVESDDVYLSRDNLNQSIKRALLSVGNLSH